MVARKTTEAVHRGTEADVSGIKGASRFQVGLEIKNSVQC